MKSYINYMADLHDAPIEKEVTIPYPKEELEKKFKAVARTGKKTISPDTIEKGDVVVLSLESELPRFNKKATFVTVGGGLFNRDLEETLLGHSQGDTYETSAEGKAVKITVKQISRTLFPEPDDEMVKEFVKSHDEYEGIDSLEGFRERVVNDSFEEARNDAWFSKMDEILDYLLTHSDFEFDEDEVKEANEQAMNFIESELKEEGKSLDSLTTQEFVSYFGVSSMDEVKEMIQINSEREIGSVLIMAKMHDMDVSQTSMEDIDYLGFDQIEDYLKEVLTIKEER